jgi:DNA-directed RNA polymerase subunit beta'
MVTKEQANQIESAGISKVRIRSLVTCRAKSGVCQKCYGLDLGRGHIVAMGQAVGTVAAQAIGEPGTQLTMRTFHIGGVAGSDITQGLPRVEEIFEARPPKGEATIVEEECKIIGISEEGEKTIKILVEVQGKKGLEQKEYTVSKGSNVLVSKGDLLGKGSPLTGGHIDLRKLYSTMGREVVHRYIVREIQEIYAAQGEGINDKHIEVIIRQMFSRIQVTNPGDTILLPGDVVEKNVFNEANREMEASNGNPAEGEQLIMGITKVALSTESFLSAASFQETARVLINAAVTGKEDRLHGLKENVIIGRLIPAGTGYREGQ